MNRPAPEDLNPDSTKSQADVELNDAEVQEIDGGAIDSYLYFPPAPKHG